MVIRYISPRSSYKRRKLEEQLGVTQQELDNVRTYLQYEALLLSHGATYRDIEDIKNAEGIPITLIRYKGVDITSIKTGNPIIPGWESVVSCFARGYWVDEDPWTDNLGWKNN